MLLCFLLCSMICITSAGNSPVHTFRLNCVVNCSKIDNVAIRNINNLNTEICIYLYVNSILRSNGIYDLAPLEHEWKVWCRTEAKCITMLQEYLHVTVHTGSHSR
jgi:hypothetical protein